MIPEMYEVESLTDSDSARALVEGWNKPLAAIMRDGRPIAIVPEQLSLALADLMNVAALAVTPDDIESYHP